jgi:signal transduction histidine kinase
MHGQAGRRQLGLSIVQEMVQAHGGSQVTVEDVEKQGTRFTLTLPRYTAVCSPYDR